MIARAMLSGYLDATPMVAMLRRGGRQVGEAKPVAWRVDPEGPAETTVSWSFDRYLRFDEACVVAGDSVVASYREKDVVSLPPGAVYEAQFVLILDEV